LKSAVNKAIFRKRPGIAYMRYTNPFRFELT